MDGRTYWALSPGIKKTEAAISYLASFFRENKVVVVPCCVGRVSGMCISERPVLSGYIFSLIAALCISIVQIMRIASCTYDSLLPRVG